jgi:uridine phosphorylase
MTKFNKNYLDSVVSNETQDIYYHFGIDSHHDIISALADIKIVVMSGSCNRIIDFADSWSKRNNNKNHKLDYDDRFTIRFCDHVLFVSHGMGMPSASIAVQEVSKMIYKAKNANIYEIEKVKWLRVGTSGGVGVVPGTIVLSTETLLSDLSKHSVLVGSKRHYFDSEFPQQTIQDIMNANKHESNINIVSGKTVTANEFFIEQMRLDGAINLSNENDKQQWLEWIRENGVKNIEMEGAMMSGYLNHLGFTSFAMMCVTLLDRIHGDQLTSTKEQLGIFTENAKTVLFNYLVSVV